MLQGSGRRAGGEVLVDGVDPASREPAARRGVVALVPQQPADLLYLETVHGECGQADHESAAPPGTCRELLDRLVPGIADDLHPMDLSEGQRLALVLAIVLTASPELVLLDEPTRSVDYPAKTALAVTLWALGADGRAVLLATHGDNLVRLLAFSLATSLGWDIGRAVTTAVLVLLTGPVLLRALRRAARRAAFSEAPRTCVRPRDVG